jgi:hypothetical protein
LSAIAMKRIKTYEANYRQRIKKHAWPKRYLDVPR